MRLLRRTAPLAAIALPLAASLGGCETTPATAHSKAQTTPQQQRENLAWSAEDTRNFARYVGEFVQNRESASADKSALLARAEILQQHAQAQAQRVAGLEFDGSPKSIIALKDLRARNDGLRHERAALNHEWDVWQVQLGIKQAEDTELSYTPELPDDGGC